MILFTLGTRGSPLVLALSLGMGEDPLDEDELPFVYEGRGGSLHPHVPITFGVNKLEVWDLGHLALATSMSAEAAKFGFLVGNAGFNGVNTDWNTLYQMHSPATYMQMANPHITDDLFPTPNPTESRCTSFILTIIRSPIILRRAPIRR